MHIVAECFREQRADRTVDQAAGENGLLARTAFAAHEAARHAADSIEALLKVDGHREEIDALARLCGSGDGDEHDGVAVTDEAGTVCQLGNLADLNDQLAAAEHRAVYMLVKLHSFDHV